MPMLCLQDPKEGMAGPSAPLPVPQVLEGLPMRKLISLVCNPPGQQWICASLRLSVCFGFALGSLQAVLWGLVERTSGERWYRYFDILKCVFLHLLDVEGFMINVCHNFSLPSTFSSCVIFYLPTLIFLILYLINLLIAGASPANMHVLCSVNTVLYDVAIVHTKV